MAIVLASKPGITSASTLAIPKEWDATWFRSFINNQLKGGDVRNAVGANGIKVSGNISSPYATISGGTAPMTIGPPTTAVTTLTVNGAATAAYLPSVLITAPNTASQSNGLQIKAGTNINDANLVLVKADGSFNYFAMLGDSSWFFSRDVTHTVLSSNAAGNVTISAPASGVAFTVNGVAGANVASLFVQAPNTSGQSNGIIIQAGNGSANDRPLDVITSNGATRLFAAFGDGSIAFGNVAITGTSPAAGGAGALPATPAGYFALNINGVARRVPFYT
jgi:hypothetical protein